MSEDFSSTFHTDTPATCGGDLDDTHIQWERVTRHVHFHGGVDAFGTDRPVTLRCLGGYAGRDVVCGGSQGLKALQSVGANKQSPVNTRRSIQCNERNSMQSWWQSVSDGG